MRDFTLKMYENLCIEFLANGYEFTPVIEYWIMRSACNKRVMIRHDVDKQPKSAAQMARLERKIGIRASYYFRVASSWYDEEIVRDVRSMGHEIGYHYEDLSLAQGDFAQAIESFKSNLSRLRNIGPVRTICMHGSPLSKWDNKQLWTRYDYREFGILGEPYVDMDFDKIFYLTDTGRRWNSNNISVRDKVDSAYTHDFRTTVDIVAAIGSNSLPDEIMVNVHPHRWNDNNLLWFQELVWQNIKNIGKWLIVKGRQWKQNEV